eukprot:TRINITY_DN2053_c0_g1_i1.p1 TRINITY_DN2053_c0_g1~~TRINITY_DN2053_c0_g1_i1.p1  ORF type:complete len:541 (+),score=130.58 TRINITY_DN2053_c0_g1_i1:22-1644(+)
MIYSPSIILLRLGGRNYEDKEEIIPPLRLDNALPGLKFEIFCHNPEQVLVTGGVERFIRETNTIQERWHTFQFESLETLRFTIKILRGSRVIGKCFFLSTDFYTLNDQISRPIVGEKSFDVIGSLTLSFCISLPYKFSQSTFDFYSNWMKNFDENRDYIQRINAFIEANENKKLTRPRNILPQTVFNSQKPVQLTANPTILQPLKHVFLKGKLRIGHRGFGASSKKESFRTPITENTFLSFQQAIDNGIDGIEFDVQPTKDEELIIFHDFFLRTAENRVQAICQMDSSSFFSFTRRIYEKHAFCAGSKEDFLDCPDAEKDRKVVSFSDFEDLKRQANFISQARSMNDDGDLRLDAPLTLADVSPTYQSTLQHLQGKNIILNVEIKYPTVEEIDHHHFVYMKKNKYVDKILDETFKLGTNLPIVFSSFDAEIVALLHFKQPFFPVLFLTEAKLVNISADHRLNGIENAVHWALTLGLPGIVAASDHLIDNVEAIHNVKDKALFMATYGHNNNVVEYAELQYLEGVDCVIADNVKGLMRVQF